MECFHSSFVQEGISPLHCASKSGHAAVVERLLAAGADVKGANRVSKKLLHSAFLPVGDNYLSGGHTVAS